MPGSHAWVLVALLAACSAPATRGAAPVPVTVAAPGPFRIVSPPGGEGSDLPVVAARVFALGDSQLRHLYGKRSFAQSPFADRYRNIEVAIRPAALDDGGDLLLGTFLAEHRIHYPTSSLVYMGDAADLSCTQEYDRFFGVMAAAGEARFLMVASNHDGFFAGNFTQKADADGMLEYTDMPNDWMRACAEPPLISDHMLTKGRAISRVARVLPEAPAWASSIHWADEDRPTSYAKAWMAYVRPLTGGDAGAPPAWGMFLDTVDYRDFDLTTAQGAGTTGSVAAAQLGAMDKAMFEAGPNVTWVAFGHHPVEDLEEAARFRVLRFFDDRPEIVAYVAAHTHFSDERTITLPSGRRLPEIIVGSTTDWSAREAPEEARLLEIRVDPATGGRGVSSRRLELDVGRLCEGIPPQMPGDPLAFASYRLERDDVPDIPTSKWGLFWAWVADSDLGPYRIAQTAGALVVESKLVRGLAHVYREAPGGWAPEVAAALAEIVQTQFPDDDGHAISPYEAWLDPIVAAVVPSLARHLHSFGGRRALFEELRAGRVSSDERRRYFACQAARAAGAEAARERRRGDVLFIR